MRIPISALVPLLLAVAPPPATAETSPVWPQRGSLEGDFDCTLPIIDRMLRDDRVGTVRPWQAPSGRHGHIRLSRGGDKARSPTAEIEVTEAIGGTDHLIRTFRYRKQARLGWAVTGCWPKL